MKRVKNFFKAFSIVELTISVVVISVVAAAFAPAISKKLTTHDIIAGDSQCILSECQEMGIDTNKSVLLSTDDYINADAEGKKKLIQLGENCTLCDKCKKECIECSISCPIGKYRNEPECRCGKCLEELKLYNITDNCVKCHWNYKLREPQCDACDKGYFLHLDSDGKYRCKKCPKGHYCLGYDENHDRKALPPAECNAEGSPVAEYQNERGKFTPKTDNPNHCATFKREVKSNDMNSDDYCAKKYQECASSNLCATCPSGYYLKDNKCVQCAAGSKPNSDATGCVCNECHTWSADSNTCYYDCDKGGCGDCKHCGYNCPPPPCEGTYTNGEYCHKSGPREGECCTHTYKYKLVPKRQACSSCPRGFSIYYKCEGVYIGCKY